MNNERADIHRDADFVSNDAKHGSRSDRAGMGDHTGPNPAGMNNHAEFMAHLEPVLAKLSRYCYALTRDAEDGRDLLSDAILLVYENFEKLRHREAFTSYAFTTARRLYYRRERRKKWWGAWTPEVEEIVDDRTPSPEVVLDTEALDRALSELPEKQREAVILFEISGLSLQEIVEIQGGSLSGVKSRIVRGREKLAVLLSDREHPFGAGTRSQPTPSSRNTITSKVLRETSSSSRIALEPAYLLREKL